MLDISNPVDREWGGFAAMLRQLIALRNLRLGFRGMKEPAEGFRNAYPDWKSLKVEDEKRSRLVVKRLVWLIRNRVQIGSMDDKEVRKTVQHERAFVGPSCWLRRRGAAIDRIKCAGILYSAQKTLFLTSDAIADFVMLCAEELS